MFERLQEEITKVAYDLYEKSGQRKGNDLVNWLAAERIVNFNQMVLAQANGEAIALLEYKPMTGMDNTSKSSMTMKSRSTGSGKESDAALRQRL